MDREALYARLPILLQNAACSLEGWRIRRTRFDARFHVLLAEYNARGAWTVEPRLAFRDARLRDFVKHAATTTPYYRALFRELGLRPDEIRNLDDLQRLPLLEKPVVQSRAQEFVSDAVPARERITMHTSGTTGAGLRFPSTQEAQREHWAVWWRFRMLHGIDFDTPCAYLGGRSVVPLSQSEPPFWRGNLPGRQTLYSGYHLSPANAGAYLDKIEGSGVPWLHGYPSLVSLLAAFALERGRRIPLRWVSLGAESVLPQQRALIQDAFGVAPLTHYSMAEAVANISQHPDANFYVDEDFAAVEFVPRAAGGFDVVGCNFSNPAFPLLRYVVGDVATLPAVQESGGFGRQVLGIDGRMEDYIVTKSGARLGRLDHIFKDMVHVREAQIVQDRAGEMMLRVVKAEGYSGRDEALLLEETRKRVGDDVDFSIAYCDALPRSKSGKLRFVVSRAGRVSGEV